MFVQVIEGKTSDAEGIKRQLQRWNDELRPGAKGFLSSTFGITADGTCIGFACFDSIESAMQNSKRPEQTAWWNETEKYYDGDVSFYDSTDVETQFGGPNAKAGFVQGMQGTVSDRSALKKIEDQMQSATTKMRPDLIGTIGAYYGNGKFTAFSYFTSEAEARAGESQPMPDDIAKVMQEWMSVMRVDKWMDLTDPWITVGK
jgi:hypothetical protein